MDIINICLVTKDVEYGLAFARTLQSQSKFFSIALVDPGISEMNDIEEYDLILVDEGSDLKSEKQAVVTLSEKKVFMETNMENGGHIIFKYQCAQDIANDIRRVYSGFYGRPMFYQKKDKPVIAAVFSSSGGVGCTSIAMGLCQELQRFHNRKVLYLTLEEFESTNFYFNRDNEKKGNGIDRFVYLLLYRKEGLVCGIEPFLMKDDYGVSSFFPSKDRNPLLDLGENELMNFLEYLTQDTGFTDIVVDCGNKAGLAHLTHLKLADQHIYVERPKNNPLKKESYFSWLSQNIDSSMRPIPVFVENFHNDDESDQDNQIELPSMDKDIVEIYEDHESFSLFENEMSVKLDKNFGIGIRELSARIIAM